MLVPIVLLEDTNSRHRRVSHALMPINISRCDETFQTQVEASSRAIFSHDVVPLHRAEDGQYICLHAELGCSALFKLATSVERHHKSNTERRHSLVRLQTAMTVQRRSPILEA
jgi:hypothetical protein